MSGALRAIDISRNLHIFEPKFDENPRNNNQISQFFHDPRPTKTLEMNVSDRVDVVKKNCIQKYCLGVKIFKF